MNFEDYLKLSYPVAGNQSRPSGAYTNPIAGGNFDIPVFEVKDLKDKVRLERVLADDEDVSIMNSTPDRENPDKELSFWEKALNKFLSIDEVREKADKDGDGEVTEDEAREYLEEVAKKDGNDEDLTMEDIDAELEELGVDLSELEEAEDIEEVIPEVEIPEEAPEASYSCGGGSYVRPEDINPLLGMSLEELEEEKEVRTETLCEKQQAVNDIHNGNNERVKAANEQLDKARDEYSKALDADPNMISYRQEIKRQLEAEQQLSLLTSENEININNKTLEITEKENVIMDLEANIAASEHKLSSLKISGREEDRAQDAKITEQKRELENAISEAKQQLKDEQDNLAKLNDELEKLNEQKEELQRQTEENQQALARSQELVNQYASETTKAKLNAYNEAVDNVAQVKADELKVATAELEKAQEAVTEVEATISAVKYRDANSIVEKAIAVAYAELRKGVHEDTGHNDGADIRRYTRGHHYAWCAAFTSYCYGDGQGSSNSETFGYQPGVKNIKAQAQRAGYYSNGATYTPQRGDLIVYGNGSHTGIVVEVNPDGTYQTIEGNTSNAVRMRNHRANDSSVSFVRMGEWIERA